MTTNQFKPVSSKHHSVIIIPGLGGNTKNIEFATGWWKSKGLFPCVFDVNWKDPSTEFPSKLKQVVRLIDKLAKKGPVSIIGTSAGASLAFNAFLERPNVVQKAVSICGRLRAGKHQWRSLEKTSAKSNSFKQSVLFFQRKEPDIPNKLRLRVMTITARFGDQLVPADTSFLKGANNIKIPAGEHLLSIGLSLTFFAKPIIDFLNPDPSDSS